MNDEFKITLELADKHYRLSCKRGEEGLIRKAATNFNNKILKWSSTYPEAELPLKDLMAMAALDISLDNITFERNEDLSPLFDRIRQLNEELKDFMASEKKLG